MAECVACGDSPAVVKFVNCAKKHAEAVYCSECFHRLVEAHFKTWRKPNLPLLQCPSPKCKQPATDDDMRAFLVEQGLKERYDDLLAKEVAEDDPLFVWCVNGSCRSGQCHVGGKEQPIVTCSACSHQQCFTCRVKYHAGMSCRKYQKLLAEDPNVQSNMAFVRSSTRKCPAKNCKFRILKANDGDCDKMECKNCGFLFCYICRVSYHLVREKDNSVHLDGCPFREPDELANGAQTTTMQKLEAYLAHRAELGEKDSDFEDDDDSESEEEGNDDDDGFDVEDVPDEPPQVPDDIEPQLIQDFINFEISFGGDNARFDRASGSAPHTPQRSKQPDSPQWGIALSPFSKTNKRVASSPSNMKMLYFSESEIITEVQYEEGSPFAYGRNEAGSDGYFPIELVNLYD